MGSISLVLPIPVLVQLCSNCIFIQPHREGLVQLDDLTNGRSFAFRWAIYVDPSTHITLYIVVQVVNRDVHDLPYLDSLPLWAYPVLCYVHRLCRCCRL